MKKRKQIKILLTVITIQLFVCSISLFADDTPTEREEFPKHWIVKYIEEPVFKSKICVIETGDKKNETVLLIHGLGENGILDWIDVIPELEKNYHVLALDLPGFGNSETPKGNLSPTNYAKIIRWLVQKDGKKKITVVGHSLGGAIALRFAATHPESVKKLILVDTAGILEKTAFLKHMAQKPGNEEDSTKNKFFKSQFNKFVGTFIEEKQDISILTKDNEITMGILFKNKTVANVAMALINEDFTDAIQTLQMETTIIWGELDNTAPLRIGKLLEKRLKNASLHIIKKGEHSVMASHTKKFNQLLLASLENHSKPKKSIPVEKSQGDLICTKEWNKTYTGTYDKIILRNCVNFNLNNITAEQIIIENSDGEIYDLTLRSTETALDVKDSVVRITVANITGKIGIRTNNGRLDLAGITLVASETGAKFLDEESYMIFSVSDLSTPLFKENIHKVYRGENTTLEEIILNTPKSIGE